MTSFNHIGLFVKNLEASMEFYNDFFGVTVVKEFESSGGKIALINIGGGQVELIQRPEPKNVSPNCDWGHIAFQVPDFEEKLKQIETLGLEKRIVTTPNGGRLCFFTDPDGHSLELMEEGL
ncbi:VOC family protein [Candidatus Bathyarchaeota archaeon]|jgi:catechol 2,3-dioxygenase-like lactoylglutathione lyase family enzyme|nr:VOC family protein [Candidatus Bathyarchaeota archaeon]MBT4320608.1 VOC family protein [Candidatus Bathyarchaeota archaeon]MBT4422755.1 VOC family protein [Candidatus Bathyarchaeota archaeon]MBT6603686.1 VOC family protein [Candidatus Bathyarchaeota archaeon]MBT7186197.1 VOC family protein [Candidatus Bathyarchaeota archaeon]